MNNLSTYQAEVRDFTLKDWVKKHNLLAPYHKGGSLSTCAVAELQSIFVSLDKTAEKYRKEGAEEAILGALSSNNPVGWLENYAVYKNIDIARTLPVTEDDV